MESKTQANNQLLQQFDQLLRSNDGVDNRSQALLGSLSGLFDLFSENEHLRRTYSQLGRIIRGLAELDRGKDLAPLLLEIATAAKSLLAADSVVILPTTADGDTFIPQYATLLGPGKRYFKSSGKPRPTGVNAYLISSPSGLLHVKDCSDLDRYPFLDSGPDSLYKTGIKTFLGLRLGNKTKIYGFFYINRASMVEFSEDTIKVAELLGSLTRIALQIHSSIETSLQPVHTQALQEIQQAINIVTDTEAEDDLQNFLSKLLETALQITGVREDGFGFVGLVNKVENKLEIFAQVGLPKEKELPVIDLGTNSGNHRGITCWVAQEGEPALVRDVRKDKRYLEIFGRETISELAVPLRVRASVIGVINLESSKSGAFSRSDLVMLEGWANLVSIAIQVIRKRQAQHADSTFANVIIASLDPDQALNRFYDYIQARTQARDMAILSYDVDKNVFRLDEFPVRASAHAKKIPDVPFGEGLVGNAAKRDKVINIPDVQQLDKGTREYIPWLDDTRANMAIPLRIGSRLIGVLNIESPTPHAFDDVDEDQLQIMASFAAIWLENAKRHQSTLNFQTSSTFVGLFVSKFHDLFGNTIKPAAVKLESLELKLQETKIQRHPIILINRLANEIEAIRKIIDQGIQDAHDLAMSARETDQLVSYLENKEHKSLEEGIDLALRRVRMPAGIQLIKNYGDDVGLALLPGPIHDIFRNLIRNSVDAIHKVGGRGTITVSAEQRLGWLYIVIQDTGCGIPEKDKDKIFEIGYTAGSRGLGLGLHVARGLVELFGGKLIIKDHKPGNTAFALSLPVLDHGEPYSTSHP
jgi:putative methionine-R-sulfoxide reductase with GAF domain